MAIIRIYTGPDGRSHFEEVKPRFEPLGDQSERAELVPGNGIQSVRSCRRDFV